MKTPSEESNRIINKILFIRKIVLLNRIFSTLIASFLLIEAIYYLYQNPYAYIVSSTFNIYLGHTRILLVILPLFIYYTWKFVPYYAPLLLGIYYGLHEFFFNSIFFVYYYPGTASSKFWLNPLFFFEIAVFVAVIVLEKFNPFQSKISTYFLIAFVLFLFIWIIPFGFIDTYNATYSTAQNALNSHAFIPNLMEVLYNLLFTGVFITSIRNVGVKP